MTTSATPRQLAPHVKALLAKAEWSSLKAKTTAYAWRKMGRKKSGWDAAEDIAQTAICQAHDPSYVHWDPETQPILLRHLCSAVNGILSSTRKRERRQRQELHAREDIERIATDRGDAEAAIVDADEFVRKIALLEEAIARDRLAPRLLQLFCEGITEAQEQAVATRQLIAEVRKARVRLFHHAEKIELDLREDG